jgi:hypothetical protein
MTQLASLKWLMLATLIGLGCNLSTTVSTPAVPTPPALTTPVAIAQPTIPALQTYLNTAFGYVIQYPTGLHFEASADQAYVWIDKQILISTFTLNPEAIQGDGPLITSAADIQVGAYPARELVGSIGAMGGNTPQNVQIVVIPHNSQYFVFMVYELKNDVALPIDRVLGDIPVDELVLFEQIVASVQFND